MPAQIPPLHLDVVLNAPLSESRLPSIVTSLLEGPADTVVDLGCGWGELLLRVLAAAPGSTGLGIDLGEESITHARGLAAARGLAGRVTFEVGDAGAWSGEADVLIVNGASHVWGGPEVEHTERALAAAARALRPGGRLLLGEGFWERPPTDDELAAMPIPREQYGTMADLVERTERHGFRLWNLVQSTRDEWDEFESKHALGYERWLLANPGSPDADEVRERSDTHRRHRLRGWRECLGYAVLTLVRPTVAPPS